MPQIERVSESEEATIALGAALGRQLVAGDVVALHGELGTGKTRFVRGLALGLGINPNAVSSPTFVLVNIYESTSGIRLAHVDGYRLQDEDSLDLLGWDRIDDGSAVIAVEWAERLPASFGRRRVDVWLAHTQDDPNRRTILVKWQEHRELQF